MAFLKPHGLWFPVDVSTAAQATIGGMAGNNSCGARSIRYGNMVHNVARINAFLADGSHIELGNHSDLVNLGRESSLVEKLSDIHRRARLDSDERWPKVLRRVGGYNLDMLPPADENLARILVGSEGTLSVYDTLELKLAPLPKHRVLGVCHFPTFYEAMASTQHIVSLKPSAVELVDRTMIELAREIAVFAPTVARCVRGQPDALLLVEFAGESEEEQLDALRQLHELMTGLGFADAVVEAIDPHFQQSIWDVRKAGLNIMMSMKGDGKPVSFIEDCAVELEDLAEYTDRLTQVFKSHNTTGTWYAHASVGCLHVRPILNLKEPSEAKKMRAIAEEAFAMVREYKGSHSGEHGDGLVRSEFHESMFGERITGLFREVKETFDENYLLNPGKIVKPLRMDDRSLFRFRPGYRTQTPGTRLDWSDWGGFAGAVEMCNNNGHCRKTKGVMCPSFQATGDEAHLTRGRANSLRLAISGQAGTQGLASPELYPSLESCLSCKGCRRECPTGIDMARMKIEYLHAYHQRHGYQFKHRLIADLPRYAPIGHQLRWLTGWRNAVPEIAHILEGITGISAKRPLPAFHARPFVETTAGPTHNDGRTVALFVDTFSRWFEPQIARSAVEVLKAAGYTVHLPAPAQGKRALCCGRTYLAVGQIDNAVAEMERTASALRPYLALGIPIIGLEPSCLLTFQDEFGSLTRDATTASHLRDSTFLFEEFLATADTHLELTHDEALKVIYHSHCHQKAFGKATHAVDLLKSLTSAHNIRTIDNTCCGMAGAFGYLPQNYSLSLAVGELGVLPAIRETADDTLVIASGTSCRHQILHGTGRSAKHPAEVINRHLARSA